MKKFATFFPYFKGLHATKDVGKIPHVLGRDYSWNSEIICYEKENANGKNDEINEVEVTEMGAKWLNNIEKFLKKTPGNLDKKFEIIKLTLSSGIYFKKNQEIDVLQLYHLRYKTLFIALIWRLINKEGALYLKLDQGSYSKAEKEFDEDWKKKFLFRAAGVDFVSIETKNGLRYIKQNHLVFKDFKGDIGHVQNGIDKKRLDDFKKSYEEKENQIIHVGRLGKKKGTDIVLKTFKEISEDYPKWKLVLAGTMSDEFEEKYEKLLNELDLDEKVEYLGFVDNEELYRLYNKSKIFIFPSRGLEGFPISPLEAMFFENICVSIDIDPIREHTDNGRLGYLCEENNAECYYQKISEAIESNTEKIAKRGGRLIREEFSWNRQCGKINNLLRD